MIKSFAHKGLKEFYETGSKKGIKPEHAPKLSRMLDSLDASTNAHKCAQMRRNWQMTFFFEKQDAYLADYMDYH